MTVTVLGASGRAGAAITRELAARGHRVRGVARRPEAIPVADGVAPVAGDAQDAGALAELVRGSDAVISALHFDVTADTLLAALRKAGVQRLLVTGGAASLEVAPGQRLFDTPDFPPEWKPIAAGGIAFLESLRQERAIDWTFLSPPAWIEEGPRTGSYRTGGDRLLTDAQGQSRISFADYAIAMVDEYERPQHSRSRFTVAY